MSADTTLSALPSNPHYISAGFYFIRDSSCVSNNLAGLKWYGESGQDCTQVLPGPPPTAELFPNKNWYPKLDDLPYTAMIRELPIAIQDMSFYDDGQETRQFYPADHDNFLYEGPDPVAADRSVYCNRRIVSCPNINSIQH